MGLFDLFKNKKRENLTHARVLNGYTPIFSQFGKDIYASDVVRQAILCIAAEAKKLDPQHVVKDGSDIVPVYDKIQKVLENPNPLMTTADFIEKIVWQLYLNYNSFILPTWNKHTGELESLTPVQPAYVELLQDPSQTMFIKMSFANKYECTLKYDDIIHIRHEFGSNEFMGGDKNGQPNHEPLLKTLELNNTLWDGVSKAAKSSFAINGVIKYNTMMDQGQTAKAIEDLSAAIRNSESGFLPLDIKGEFIPFKRDVKLVDADTLKFVDEKILRTFGVSLPILTGDYTKEQYEAFYQKTLEPLIKSISQAFTKCIFSQRQSFGYGHKIQFYPKDLIFLNTTQKLEMIRLLGDSGGLFENEKRALMGLKPLAELKGVRLQSLNYVDVEIAKDYQTKTPPSTPTAQDNGEVEEEVEPETENIEVTENNE